MPTLKLEVPEKQIVDWVKQLPIESKREILRSLIPNLDTWDSLLAHGNTRIREVCVRRGVDWDSLTEDGRMEIIDDILHEP